MRIGEIVWINQKDVYKELKSKYKNNKKRKRKPKKITESEIEEIMKHDSYSRSKGGALRQKT